MNTTQNLIDQFQSGQIGRAWAGVKKALKTHPKNPDLLNLAGVIALKRGKELEGQRFLKAALRSKPPYSDPYRTLALSLIARKPEEAEKVARLAIDRFPQDGECWATLSAVLNEIGQRTEALDAIEKAVALAPRDAEFWNQLCVLRTFSGEYEQAVVAGTRATTISASANALTSLGQAYSKLGELEQALKSYRNALELEPGKNTALEGELVTLLSLNRIDAAVESARALLKVHPESGFGWYHLAKLKALEEEEVPESRKTNTLDESAFLLLAQAEHAKRKNNFDEAVRSLMAANKLLAKLHPYVARTEAMKGTHARTSWANLSSSDDPISKEVGPTSPIFIIGMMRSGTTLLERMLSNHEAVYGLGEIGILDRVFREHRDAKTAVDIAALSDAKRKYSSLFANQTEDAKWVIDKMPINMRYAGFLKRMWPECKIIHLQRHPNDVATSIFETVFDSQAQNFSFTEAGIIEHFEEHERQVAFWQSEGIEMLTVNYEDLVTSSETELGRIAQYCGIPFSEEMLHPERNAASIQTASVLQARNPINTKSIGRWRERPELLPNLYAKWAEGWER